MSYRPRVHALLLACGFIAVLSSLYCALWFLSSSSLACVECNCEYSLLAVNPRCRQPYIAMVLTVLAAVAAAAAFIAAGKLRRHRRNEA